MRLHDFMTGLIYLVSQFKPSLHVRAESKFPGYKTGLSSLIDLSLPLPVIYWIVFPSLN